MSKGGPSDFLVGQFKPLLSRYPTALANVFCCAQCGPGWMSAIVPVLELCERDGVAVHQIKEKFGGLRIYVGSGTEAVHAAIKEAEAECWKICEECGTPGHRRGGGWIKTLCDPCQETRDERRAEAWR